MSDLFLDSGATFSACGTYRYHLWRVWDLTRPIMVFVMLNPSTADADQDDPTIRRCIGFARRDDYGGISVRNVFALRATDPKQLLTHPDPFGPENDAALLEARDVSMLTRLVAAWGTRMGGRRLRDYYCGAAGACVVQGSYCLGTTKGGDPRHPLHVRGDAALAPWHNPGY